jgi:antitoxin MazE
LETQSTCRFQNPCWNAINSKDKLELILEEDQIIIRAAPNSREGWAEAFKVMNKNGDDNLLIQDVFEDE